MRREPMAVPLSFYLVATANFLFFLNVAFLFLLPLWILQRGGGEEEAGRVAGTFGFAGLLVLPLVGYLLDRFGRRRFLIGGAAVSALCSAAYLAIDEIGPSLYALQVVHGVACTCAFTGAQTLAVLFAPFERRAQAIGWFGISTILTHAISPALGEEIIRRWGFDAMFATGACVGTAAFLLACSVPPPPPLRVGHTAGDADPALARRAVMTASIAMVCYGVGFGATQTFVPILIERFAIGRVGAFFATWSICAVAVRALLGGASDRFGRRAVIVPAMMAMSVALVVLSATRSMSGMLVAAIIFGTAQGLLYPTMNALVTDWSSAHNIGRTQSLFSGSYSLGIATCSFFFGTVAERHGFTVMFLAAFAITLVGLATFLAGPRESPGLSGADYSAAEELVDVDATHGELQ